LFADLPAEEEGFEPGGEPFGESGVEDFGAVALYLQGCIESLQVAFGSAEGGVLVTDKRYNYRRIIICHCLCLMDTSSK